MSDFSNALNEDQLQLQKWVHDFAENVVRPAAHEWDEREETPWPIIEEAARIGLYSLDFVAIIFGDPTGISVPMVMEEMAWGDAGIGLAIFGTTLGVAGIFGNGTPEQIAEWVPQCFGTPDKIALAAFCVSEAGRRLRRQLHADPSRLRRGHRRVGAQRHQDLDHQRRHRRHPRGGGLGRSRAERPGPGQLHRAAGHQGSEHGPEVQEDGHPGFTYRRGRARRRSHSGPAAARRQGEARRAPGPGPRRPDRPAVAGRPVDLRDHPARGRRPKPSASPGPPTSTPSTTPRSAGSSAGPSSRTRPSPSSWPRCA